MVIRDSNGLALVVLWCCIGVFFDACCTIEGVLAKLFRWSTVFWRFW